MDCFGRLVHVRAPYDVHHPEPDGRYQSLMTVSQDHSTEPLYSRTTVVLATDNIGTRYVALVVRTFADPDDPADLARAHASTPKWSATLARDDPAAYSSAA